MGSIEFTSCQGKFLEIILRYFSHMMQVFPIKKNYTFRLGTLVINVRETLFPGEKFPK